MASAMRERHARSPAMRVSPLVVRRNRQVNWTTRTAAFYLMKADAEPQPFHSETSQVRWVDKGEARKLISLTKTDTGRKRDLAVLDAALKLWKENAP